MKFARGGVGAIISSFVPVHSRGRILPNSATIDRDSRIPFWRELGRQVHEHDCKFILQLSLSGNERYGGSYMALIWPIVDVSVSGGRAAVSG